MKTGQSPGDKDKKDRRNRMNRINRRLGVTLVELVAAVALMGIFFLITAPVIFQMGNIYRTLGSRSVSKDKNRVFGAIGNYLDSASREKIHILSIGDRYISGSADGNLEELISKKPEGDALYIEIEVPHVMGGRISFRNQVHIFRFYPTLGIQNLRYIPTEKDKMGNSGGKLILGKDEILIQGITGGSFSREGNRIVIRYLQDEREEILEWSLRDGIW